MQNDKLMLEIIHASYGSKDITTQIKGLVKDGELKVKASNDIFGDPDVGQLKYLTISYADKNGNIAFEKVKEGGYVSLPKTKVNRLGIFYTNNNVDKVVQKSLESLTKFKGKADILTCVWNPIPDNPFYQAIAMTKSSNHLNIVIQILQLLYVAKEIGDYKYVSFLEHDVLYPDGYFDFPDFETGVQTNMNYMGVCTEGWQVKTAAHEPLHQMTMIFSEAITHFENMLREAIRNGGILLEPQSNRTQWFSKYPAVHMNHGKHFTSHFNIYSKETYFVDKYWGDFVEYRDILVV